MKNSVPDGKVPALAKAVFVSALAIAAAAAVNAFIFYRTPPLTTELEGGDVRYYPTEIGDIFYQRSGSGPALLLVHGIGAGESSYEFRNVWRALARTHTVYAIDLMGFGKSDKPRIDYDAETYITLIGGFVRDVILGADGHETVSVAASSLSAAFTAAAADRAPADFDRLIFICPTGIEELTAPATPIGAAFRGLLRTPVLGTTLYNLVAGKPFIRSYLRRMIYASPSSVTEAVVDHYHVAAHQIGGERVLPSFVTGFLNVSIEDAIERLKNPVLVVWGREARQSPVRRAEAFARARVGGGNLTLAVIERAGMLPQEEAPSEFVAALQDFLGR